MSTDAARSLTRNAMLCLAVGASAIAFVYFLRQEETRLWHLASLGAAAGMSIGGIGWGRRGVVIGLGLGLLLGAVAPVLYIPFWLAFTLPPHPKIDL